MVYTLIFVTMLAPSPMLAHYTYPSKAICENMLDKSVEGLLDTFNGAVVGSAKIHADEVTTKNGWTTLRTPVGRVVATLGCEASGGES